MASKQIGRVDPRVVGLLVAILFSFIITGFFLIFPSSSLDLMLKSLMGGFSLGLIIGVIFGVQLNKPSHKPYNVSLKKNSKRKGIFNFN